MTLASRISDLVTALGSAINARAGSVGASAYDLAVINGYTGTQAQWLIDSKPRGVRARANAVQTLGANTNTVINLATTDYNDDATVFTVASDGSGITVLMAGLYLLNWEITTTLTAASTGSAYVTGAPAPFASSDNSAGTGAERNGSVATRLTAGTKLVLNWYGSASGSTSNIGVGANYLAITRLTN